MESRLVRPFPAHQSRQDRAHSLGLTRRMRRNRKRTGRDGWCEDPL